jgi:hypothetical protein
MFDHVVIGNGFADAAPQALLQFVKLSSGFLFFVGHKNLSGSQSHSALVAGD